MEERKEDIENAPFNLANATLENINLILRNIALVNMAEEKEGKAQHIKAKLIRQLFVSSCVLTEDEEWKGYMKNKTQIALNSLIIKNVSGNGRDYKTREIFYPALEMELDNIVLEIQEIIRKGGYFIPKKNNIKW